MTVDETVALSEVLREYQQNSADNRAEAKLAIALTRVVENNIRPALVKRLRPQDVNDVCSEVIFGFWKFRHSVRPDEVDKLLHTLKHRRATDQLREYYRADVIHADEPASEERGLMELFPSRDGKPGTEASQDVWELLSDLGLKSMDRVIAYLVYIGSEKCIIASALNIDTNTVTNSIKRCRKALLDNGYGNPKPYCND